MLPWYFDEINTWYWYEFIYASFHAPGTISFILDEPEGSFAGRVYWAAREHVRCEKHVRSRAVSGSIICIARAIDILSIAAWRKLLASVSGAKARLHLLIYVCLQDRGYRRFQYKRQRQTLRVILVTGLAMLQRRPLSILAFSDRADLVEFLMPHAILAARNGQHFSDIYVLMMVPERPKMGNAINAICAQPHEIPALHALHDFYFRQQK